MSLLVCLRGTDGLVLATDSRGTFGDPRGVTAQNDLIKKLYLANSRVGILVSGAGDLGSTVVESFMALPDTAGFGVTDLTMALHRYARKQFAEWFTLFNIKPSPHDPRPARPNLNFIVAGFELDNEPKIYRLSSSLDFAPMLHSYGFGIDGVAQYALYLLNRLYDPESVMEDLQYLAAYVITETASQDGKIGGPVQMATITTESSQLMRPLAVEQIINTNLERSHALKTSFLKKDFGLGNTIIRHAASDSAPKPPPVNHVVLPMEDSSTTSDALSTLPEEASGDGSSGTVW